MDRKDVEAYEKAMVRSNVYNFSGSFNNRIFPGGGSFTRFMQNSAGLSSIHPR
ncbi:MAG TPA: hypothetical protein IAA10_11940 [Candidatus Blautia intestinavium]|nr:hypothetical protein [Candidatus Blautia intestinavium]